MLNNKHSVGCQWLSIVQELPKWLYPDTIVAQCCLVTCVTSPPPGFFVLLAMAVYTGVTVNYYGKRYGSWRFSWSYIMGWVAVVLTFFSGLCLCTGEHTCRCSRLSSHTCCFFVFFSFLPREGIFYMCAYRMHECPRNSNSRWLAIEVNACSHIRTGQRIIFQRDWCILPKGFWLSKINE